MAMVSHQSSGCSTITWSEIYDTTILNHLLPCPECNVKLYQDEILSGSMDYYNKKWPLEK